MSKEMIKQVVYKMTGIYYHCPDCGEQMIIKYQCKYCPECGQKLGWEVVNKEKRKTKCTELDINRRCKYYRKQCKGYTKCDYIKTKLWWFNIISDTECEYSL